jgi:CRISPR-associated protein Cas2
MAVSVAHEAPLYTVCYDVSDNRERRGLDKLLKGYGFRIQKSVFECHMSATQKQSLYAMLAKTVLRTGHVRIYQVYAQGKAKTFGEKAVENADDAFSYSI